MMNTSRQTRPMTIDEKREMFARERIAAVNKGIKAKLQAQRAEVKEWLDALEAEVADQELKVGTMASDSKTPKKQLFEARAELQKARDDAAKVRGELEGLDKELKAF